MTISELLSTILDAADRAPEAMVKVNSGVTHFREGIADFQEAGVIITGRAASQEPQSVTLTADEQAKVSELAAVLDRAEGVAGDRSGVLTNLFLFLKENPEVIAIILKFFKL